MKDVIPGMPAAKAGLAPGMKLIAVNGRQYSKEILRDALKLGKLKKMPLELLTEAGQFYHSYQVDYHDGEKYPYLERDSSKPELMSAIIHPSILPGLAPTGH